LFAFAHRAPAREANPALLSLAAGYAGPPITARAPLGPA